MPEFELVLGKPRSFAILSQATDHYLPSMPVDFTGSRVAKYMELLEMAKELRHQRHYLSCPDKCYAFQPILLQTAKLNTVQAVLSGNRSRDGIYALAESFQYNTVVKWRGERKRAQILCPPVSADDETTKKGAGNVTLSMLELCGILNVDVASTDISLGDDIFNRWLILVGDGLSHVRVANFKDCMEDRSRNFQELYHKSTIFAQALGRIVMVPGDLHGGDFHFLMVIFHLFYGGFLQVIQVALGWKKIRGTDVTKTYEQLAQLAIIVLTEVERQLYATFITNLDETTEFDEDKNSPASLADYLASSFPLFLQTKLDTSTDEVFRMMVQFVILTRRYRRF